MAYRGKDAGYHVEPFGSARRMVAAAATVNRETNVIHLVTEADLTQARLLMASHRERTGERLSLTAYIVTCLARTFDDFPRFNSFRKGSRLIILDDLTISVLIEREIEHQRVPEPIGLRNADRKSFRQIHEELRVAQERTVERLGAASGMGWTHLIPGPLLRTFVRLASRNIGMQKRYGVVSVTAIGMFGRGPLWLVPLTAATVTLAVGGIEKREILVDGVPQSREYLCLTVSFNHDIIDGAPAARFTSRLVELLVHAEPLKELTKSNAGATSDEGTREAD
ncbi:MAG: 2-oxo acid dehydrogenase subunit E2 [Armatimonadetes bacterium]|nr:2-oxo acid dehydrogenase subunit E2 [Armatimonadota bacterium]